MENTTTDSTVITVRINGDAQTLPAAITIEDVLRRLGRDPGTPGVAVALNDAVVRRAEWPDTTLDEGDRVEVITASQGG